MRMDREKVGEMEGSLVELGKENEHCGQIIKKLKFFAQKTPTLLLFW